MNNLVENLHADVYANIKKLMDNARTDVAKQVNNILVKTYWEIGRIIVEDEQGHSDRAEYGKTLLKDLSKMLTKEFGRGFSVSNLQFMRRFYQEYEIQQTLSVKLSWSHYCELLSIDDMNKRSFYEKETVNANWSVRELKRQINTSLFERLLLSSGDENKEKVLALDYDLFSKDAITLDKLVSRSVTLKSKNHNKAVKIDFQDFPYLILWSTANKGPFIAIEPWGGLSTSKEESVFFNYKENVTFIEPEMSDYKTYSIEITEI